jgi:hypothetical protein
LDSGALLRRAAQGEALAGAERAALAEWLLGNRTQTTFFSIIMEDVALAVGERLRWLPAVWAALAAGPLDVAGYSEAVRCEPEELFCFHLPLAQLLLRGAAACEGRYLVAIAGLPAGGKSVFTAILARVLRACCPPFGIAAVGLDGYHYPNAYLAARPAPPGVPEPGPLKHYKGAHFTFNAARLAADLSRLRETREAVALPAYDRTIHDPVEGRIVVAPTDRLVLVEGNYLLYRRDGWEGVAGLFDLRIFLSSPPGGNREPMIARHMRGGRSREDAERHYERVDEPNARLIAATCSEADILAQVDENYAVRAIAAGPRAL